MNAVMAYILWQNRNEPTRLVWLVVSLAVMVTGRDGGGGKSRSMMPQDAAGVSRPGERMTGPVIYSVGTTAVLLVLFRVPALVRAAGGGLDDLEPDAAVLGPVDARSELRGDRGQAG